MVQEITLTRKKKKSTVTAITRKGKLSLMKGKVNFVDGQVRSLNLQTGPPYL